MLITKMMRLRANFTLSKVSETSVLVMVVPTLLPITIGKASAKLVSNPE
jgi:hypothetical protein